MKGKKAMETRTRYIGPFREEWYSTCSRHQEFSPSCGMCNAGQWRNCVGREVESWVYLEHKDFWLLWANRPHWNGGREFLEATFPGLRREEPPPGFWGKLEETFLYFLRGLHIEEFVDKLLTDLMLALDGLGATSSESPDT